MTNQSLNDSIRVLHLTDAHIGNPDSSDQRIVLKPLLKDLKVEFGAEVPDVIVFSGDLVWGEDVRCDLEFDEQFEEARLWLQDIAAIWGKTLADIPILIVPGNHDVQRSLIDSAHTEWILGKSEEQLEVAAKNKDRTWIGIQQRLSLWWQFAKDIMGSRWSYDDNLMMSYGDLDVSRINKRIAFVGFNTAWASHANKERTKLRFLNHQLDKGFSYCSDADIKIAVHHHPIDWMHAEEHDNISHKLQHRFQIALHGHVHSQWYESFAHGHLKVTGGACWAGTKSDTNHGYSFLVINEDLNSVEIRARQYYDSGKPQWGPASNLTLLDVHGRKVLSISDTQMPELVADQSALPKCDVEAKKCYH